MSYYYPPAYNAGEGLILLDDNFRRLDGSPVDVSHTTDCLVTLDHPPFSLINAFFYSFVDTLVGETIDISGAISSLSAAAVAAGHTLDYFRLAFAIAFEGDMGLMTCGDPDFQEANFDGEGPIEAVSHPANGWETDWDANDLTISLDGTPADMAAILNGATAPVFTSTYTQVVSTPRGPNIAFGGDILRATAHTWTGQDPTNIAARTMFTPGEVTNVTWGLNTADVGHVTSGGFGLNVLGYRLIGGTTPPPPPKGFVAVL